MQWILDNWVTVLLIGGFIGAHFFMHGRGGHGGHGGHGGAHQGKKSSDSDDHQHDEDGQVPQTVDNAEAVALTGEVVADNSNTPPRAPH